MLHYLSSRRDKRQTCTWINWSTWPKLRRERSGNEGERGLSCVNIIKCIQDIGEPFVFFCEALELLPLIPFMYSSLSSFMLSSFERFVSALYMKSWWAFTEVGVNRGRFYWPWVDSLASWFPNSLGLVESFTLLAYLVLYSYSSSSESSVLFIHISYSFSSSDTLCLFTAD